MRNFFKKIGAALLAIVLLIIGGATLTPTTPWQEASAAITYKTGANSISSSYQTSKYYSNLQALSLTGDGVTDVLAVALSQLGYQEGNSAGSYSGTSAGSKNYTEYCYNMGDFGYGYGGGNYPWCATFVSWALLQSGVTTHSKISDWCRSHQGDINYIWREVSCVQWANQLNRFGYYKNSAAKGGNYQPKTGDLIFFKTPISHIGIVVYSTSTTVYTIEGNTSDSSGVDTNGGGAYYKSYSLTNSNINGYGTLPYTANASAPKVDYTGANKTAGLYISRAEIPLGSVTIPKYTVFTVTDVSGNTVTINYGGVVGTAYVTNSNALQISAVAGGNTGGSTGGDTGGSSTPTESDVLVGVDVSKWQGTIDWAKVKQDGIDFAILRICTHNSATHTYALDPTFETNLAGAKAQGIPLGVYFYSYANNIQEVTAEANMIVDILDNYPATFSFPIAFDAEHASIKDFAASACKTFCQILEDNGYFAMVYSNTNWYNNVLLPTSEIEGLALWQAHYKSAFEGTTPAGAPALASLRPTISNGCDGNVKIWQFTSSGSVSGISGLVDMNIAYYDYSQLIPKLGLNGYGSSSGGGNTTPTPTPDPTPTPTTTKYAGSIDGVNGATAGWGINGSPITQTCPVAVGQDNILKINSGWLVVDGGQGDFYYSLDGVSWTKATATRSKGEDAIAGVAGVYGVSSCDLSNARFSISVDLSGREGHTLTVHFAIKSTAKDETIQFLTLNNVVVPAHTHSYTYTTQSIRTCELDGIEIGVCACGHKVSRVGTLASGHAFGKWQVAIAPTLTGEGLLERICGHDSSHVRTQVLPALSETDYDYAVTTPSACEVTGEAEYETEVDGQTFTFTVELVLLEHAYGNWQLTTTPTLTGAGLLTKVCSHNSAHTQTKDLPALNTTDYTYEVVGTPVCGVAGEAEYSIVVDDQPFVFTVALDAIDHAYGNWQLTTTPTLTSAGLLTKVCSHNSAHTQTKDLPMLNTTDYIYEVVGTPVCGVAGEAEYSIVVDDQPFVFTVALDAIDHAYGNWQLTTTPTLTSAGLLTKVCSHNSAHTQTRDLPMLNTTDYTYSVVSAPSCEEIGTGNYSREVDGQAFNFIVVLAALEHIDEDSDHICDRCTATLAGGDENPDSGDNGGNDTPSQGGDNNNDTPSGDNDGNNDTPSQGGNKPTIKVGCFSSAGLGAIGLMTLLATSVLLCRKNRKD